MSAPAIPQPVRHPWLIVAKREIMAQLTSRVFWIGTLSTIGVILLAFVVSNLMAGMGGTSRVAVATDEAAAIVEMARASGTDIEAVRVEPDGLEAAVGDGRAGSALFFDDGWQLTFDNPADAPMLGEAVRSYQIQHNALESGVDPSRILAHTELTMVPLGGDDTGATAIFVATFAFALLFMFSAMTFGMQIAQSVVTEKESRIVEILAAAVPIRQLLVGKVVGNTILALSQVVLIVAAALVGMSFTEYRSMIALVAPVTGWFVLFFLVGFASLACLWAAAGAMATRVQDLSQTTTPLTTIVMLVYIVGMFARGTMAQVLSYVPIASTVVMPGRLLNGDATWVEALISFVVSAAFMTVAIWLGEQVYRRGLLQTNSVLRFKEAFRKAE